MTEVSRRTFLRNVSVGAVAVGAVAVGGPAIVGAVESSTAAPSAASSNEESEGLEGSDVFARVVDAKAGTIKIFVGTKAVDYTNPALAQQLMQAAL